MKKSIRYLVIIALFVLFTVFLLDSGRQAYFNHLTANEQARIEAIMPSLTAKDHPQRLQQQSLIQDLQWLSHADRQGRLAGNQGHKAVQEKIVTHFQQLGLQPFQQDSFRHPFQTAHTQEAVNIIGYKPATLLSKKERQPIVVSAHYDHLGIQKGNVYHGADDNASGVAALLAIATYLSTIDTHHPFLFIATDQEEQGLLGAHELFNSGLLNKDTVAMNINMDMVSRNTNRTLFAVGTYHYPWLTPLIQKVQQQSTVHLLMAHDRPKKKAGYTPDWTKASDHYAFHKHHIPFVYFGVADHPDYHQPTDTADKVDPDFYLASTEAILDFILLVDTVLAEK